MRGAPTTRIGYITSRYPLVTHTFIQREVAGLRALGHDVTTFTVRASEAAELLTEADRRDAAETVEIYPRGLRRVLTGVVAPTLRHPGAVARIAWRAMRSHRRNPVAALWRLFYVAEALVLWKACVERDIRHLHAHHANVASDLAWLASEFGRLVGDDDWTWTFTLHGPVEFMAVGDHDLDHKAASAGAVACISDFTRSQLMLHSDQRNWSGYEVVRCSVDTTRFSPSGRRRIAASDPFTVVSVGRVTDQKGFPVLINAMAELQSRVDTPVRLVLAGDGPDRPRLEAAAGQLGIDVDFRGAVGQDAIVDLYHEADAFCLPSFMEGLPVVLMEALACGLPVVTSDVAGIGELVEHDVTGLLARPGRPDLVAEQLARLVEDPELGGRLGDAGRVRVEAEFDTAVTSRAMSNVLRGVLGEPRLDVEDGATVIDLRPHATDVRVS